MQISANSQSSQAWNCLTSNILRPPHLMVQFLSTDPPPRVVVHSQTPKMPQRYFSIHSVRQKDSLSGNILKSVAPFFFAFPVYIWNSLGFFVGVFISFFVCLFVFMSWSPLLPPRISSSTFLGTLLFLPQSGFWHRQILTVSGQWGDWRSVIRGGANREHQEGPFSLLPGEAVLSCIIFSSFPWVL